MLVFCPSSRAGALRLREAGASDAPWLGYAATPGLWAAAGLGPAEIEEAEFVALGYAGVAALVTTAEPLRLVLAADVADRQVAAGEHDDLGEVNVHDLRWAQVTALFGDDPAAGDLVARTRSRLTLTDPPDPAAALAQDSVAALLEQTDLLWYDPTELDSLP